MSMVYNPPYSLRNAKCRYTTPLSHTQDLICPPAPKKLRKRPMLNSEVAHDIPSLRYTPLERQEAYTTPPPSVAAVVCPTAPKKKRRNEHFGSMVQGQANRIPALEIADTVPCYWLRSRDIQNSIHTTSVLRVQPTKKTGVNPMESRYSKRLRRTRNIEKSVRDRIVYF